MIYLNTQHFMSNSRDQNETKYSQRGFPFVRILQNVFTTQKDTETENEQGTALTFHWSNHH